MYRKIDFLKFVVLCVTIHEARTYLKGVYYALVLTVRNPRKISNCLSKTKQRGCPVGVLYTYPKYRTAIGVSVPHMATIGMEVVLYISAWGLCVARFDKQGNILGASNREASDSAGLHAFFCVLKFNHFL